MEIYDSGTSFLYREHIIEIELQSDEFKGSFQLSSRGNNTGMEVLETFSDFDEDYLFEGIIKNDIGLYINDVDGDGEFTINYELKNKDGNICSFEDAPEDFKKRIVGLKIVEAKNLNFS